MENTEILLQAPKVKRTHVYVMAPISYEIMCPICKDPNTEWSEFEKHIWCSVCKKDIYLPLNQAGIFSGPIPVNACHLLGISLDRMNIETTEIVPFKSGSELFNRTWVVDKQLSEYEAKISVLL